MHIYTFYLTDTEEPNACCNNVLHFLQFKNTIPNKKDIYVNVIKANNYCFLLQVFELHARSNDGDLVSNEA